MMSNTLLSIIAGGLRADGRCKNLLIVPELLKFFDKTWTVLFEILKHHQYCRGSVHLVYPCLSRSSASLGLNRGIGTRS